MRPLSLAMSVQFFSAFGLMLYDACLSFMLWIIFDLFIVSIFYFLCLVFSGLKASAMYKVTRLVNV